MFGFKGSYVLKEIVYNYGSADKPSLKLESHFVLYHVAETEEKLYESITHKCHELTHILSGESRKQTWPSSQLISKWEVNGMKLFVPSNNSDK